MKVSKLQAAEANLDLAIEAFLAGNWVSAIHLAGAAEEVCGRLLESKGGATNVDSLWQTGRFNDLLPNKRRFVGALNFVRDWIKHSNSSHPSEIELEEPHAVLAVLRAVISYSDLTKQGRASNAKFLKWYEANEQRLDAIVERWPDSMPHE
jgi:hypothetical protein